MKYARKPQPAFTPGDDQPETPCTRDVAARLEVKAATGEYPPSPFDVLMDKTTGWNFSMARREAITMCGECPIRLTCHAINADEDWVKALRIIHRKVTPSAEVPQKGDNEEDGPDPVRQHVTGPSPHHSTQPRSEMP